MQKNLVIVESPAKAKTIEKFLGPDYKVLSSYGHIRDLEKKDLGIDIANNFEPMYAVPADKKEIVATLKKEAKKADIVWLASDEDREGEAISWHLYETLNLKPENTKRIAFHEITKNAILEAIDNPRAIDINLVDAQQARRIIDRIVGFEVSPILWRKIKPSLSAGRVQSVAVKLIVERERDIEKFQSEASYRISAIFRKDNSEFKAELSTRIPSKQEALKIIENWNVGKFSVDHVEKKPTKRSPAAPFTTSTLQQEASRKLGFPVGMTMSVAQRLYESGKITYMRTDSVNLSKLALNEAKNVITNIYGKEYVKTRTFTTKAKGAQEAHEAIRPTNLKDQKVSGTPQEQKLYDLIWKRTVASQMADAELEKTIININVSSDPNRLQATGEVIVFPGFLNVYLEGNDDDDEKEDSSLLPVVVPNEILDLKSGEAIERFTQKPARFTEASLVRKMEDLGIGRPSTYAPTISTILNREYVEKSNLEGEKRNYNLITLNSGKISDTTKSEITGADKNKLIPTDIGTVVNDYLDQHFPNILEFDFTARIEKEFDNIAEGTYNWKTLLQNFYQLFHPAVEKALNTQEEHRVGERVLGVDTKTNRQISVRIGRFGPMAQIGVQEDEEKPLFASLRKDQSIATITLEETLKLFDLPRNLGEYEDKVVTVAIGRFGPYIRHNSKFVSLPKEYDPYSVNLEEAIILIENKRKADLEKVLKNFGEINVLKGRFGPYIEYNKNNYKIPKGTEVDSLTEEICQKIIDESPAPKEKKGKPKAKTKVETKKAPAKAKATTKKTKAATTSKTSKKK